jgi:hypothetical protein
VFPTNEDFFSTFALQKNFFELEILLFFLNSIPTNSLIVASKVKQSVTSLLELRSGEEETVYRSGGKEIVIRMSSDVGYVEGVFLEIKYFQTVLDVRIVFPSRDLILRSYTLG